MSTIFHLREDIHIPPLRHVSAVTPFSWLSRGWDDFCHHPAASLAYGGLITLFGILMLGFPGHPYTIAALICGFMLVGPILAAGLCELSRLRSHNNRVDFETSLQLLRRHRDSLFRYAGVLLFISLIWFSLSGVILYQTFGSVGPSLTDNIWGDILSKIAPMQLVAYFLIAALLAVVVFVLSVVAVPMILDRDADAMTAMQTSLRVVLAADLPAMIVWGGLCTLLTVLGFATYLLGMVVIFPVLGHATWYAYRDLVK